jgi:hypothetical protein
VSDFTLFGGRIMHLSFKPYSPTSFFAPSIVITRLICMAAIVGFTYCGGIQDAAAQFDGIDGGDIGLPTDGGGFGDLGTGTGGGIGGDGGAFGDNFGDVLGGEETADQRNQGFVGATGTRIQENGFIGSPGELSASPIAGDGSFGGGTNDVGGGGGGANGGGNNRNRNNGFGGTGDTKGFEVFRSSVRANLRPQFSSPQLSSVQIANRFQSRVQRIPNMTNDGSGVQISITNQTATIQGFVGSFEELNRIQRQLRLEPGVYRINNQAQVIGQ